MPFFIALLASLLWFLNRFYPSRNAGIGLRFPGAFRSLKAWQAIQSDFYAFLIVVNLSLGIYACWTQMSVSRRLIWSVLTILGAGAFSIFRNIKRDGKNRKG